MTDLHTVYLGLGTNLGDRAKNLDAAVLLLSISVGTVTKRSSTYETEPWGFVSEHAFLNACVRVETALSPRQLLAATQAIERQLGRTEKSTDGSYHDRIIDIDILRYDDLEIDEPGLKIPHPHMLERDFVMKPLKEIL